MTNAGRLVKEGTPWESSTSRPCQDIQMSSTTDTTPTMKRQRMPGERAQDHSSSSSGCQSIFSAQSDLSQVLSLPESETVQQPSDLISCPRETVVLESPTKRQIHNKLESLKRAIIKPNSPLCTYLKVTSINQELFEELQTEPGPFKGVRTTVNHLACEVLYKVMVGRPHEYITAWFRQRMTIQLFEMGLSLDKGSFVDFGSARFKGHICDKEPDWSFIPGDLLIGDTTHTPSLVLETGVAESYNHLKTVARWWYSNTNRETKLVIILHATHSPEWTVGIELWAECVNTTPGPVTRDRPSHVLACMSKTTIRKDCVEGDPLVIPFELLFRRPPAHAGEGDIVIPVHSLQRLARYDV